MLRRAIIKHQSGFSHRVSWRWQDSRDRACAHVRIGHALSWIVRFCAVGIFHTHRNMLRSWWVDSYSGHSEGFVDNVGSQWLTFQYCFDIRSLPNHNHVTSCPRTSQVAVGHWVTLGIALCGKPCPAFCIFISWVEAPCESVSLRKALSFRGMNIPLSKPYISPQCA